MTQNKNQKARCHALAHLGVLRWEKLLVRGLRRNSTWAMHCSEKSKAVPRGTGICSYYTDRNRHEMTHLCTQGIQHQLTLSLSSKTNPATYENRSHLSFGIQTYSGISSPLFAGGFSEVLWGFWGVGVMLLTVA